jgi:hypothetical protein
VPRLAMDMSCRIFKFENFSLMPSGGILQSKILEEYC